MNIDYHSIQNELEEIPEILAVYAFGSSVRGNSTPLSDIDIGIVLTDPENIFTNPQKYQEIYDKVFRIFIKIVNSKKLDLLFLQKTGLAVQKEAVLDGEIIYTKDLEKTYTYKENVMNSYLDFKPVINYFNQKIIERGLYGSAYLQNVN